MKWEEDLKDGIYTGLVASAVGAYFYGLKQTVNLQNYVSLPTWVYIGLVTSLGTTISQVFVDADEPLLAAATSGAFTIGANAIVYSPVTPVVAATVSAPAAYLRQYNKK
jgi:hypothetical protein